MNTVGLNFSGGFGSYFGFVGDTYLNQFGAGGGISYNGIFNKVGIELITLYSVTTIDGNSNDGFTTSLRLKFFFGPAWR